MKLKQLLKITVVTCLVLGFTACESDDEVKLANLDVDVTIASTFGDLSLSNMYVYVTNIADNSVDSMLTDAEGTAAFIDLGPGTYQISASLHLSAEEAGAASGYYEEMTLNAIKSDVVLVGGVDAQESIELDGKPGASLVIKEFYYNGAKDPSYSILFKDQFIEIYNNSSEVVYADGLYVANLGSASTGASANDVALGLDLTEYVYADKILQVPGNGTDYAIQPGESIVISLNAVDYTDGGSKADITVDNSKADFETYAVTWLSSLGRTGNAFFDLDNADVANMECIYLNIENYGWFNFGITSASVVIFRNDNFVIDEAVNPNKPTPGYSDYYAKIAVADIIDGIDMMYNAETSGFKRLPASIDASFNHLDGASYSSKSVRRKVAKEIEGRKILMDTNNSGSDFEVIDLATPKSFN